MKTHRHTPSHTVTHRHTVTLLTLLFFISQSLTAQIQFSLKAVDLPKSIEQKVSEQVSNFQAYELDVESLNHFLKMHKPSDTTSLNLNFRKSQKLHFDVIEHEIRAANYTGIVQTEKEAILLPRGRCNTYRSLKGQKDRLVLYAAKDYFSASYDQNNERMVLMSLSNFCPSKENAQKKIVIFHKESDLIKSELSCGMSDFPSDVRPIGTPPSVNLTERSSPIRFVELALVANFGFTQHFGSGEAAIDKMLGSISLVNLEYEDNFNTKFLVVYCKAFESVPFDYPFNFNNDVRDNWDRLRSYFNPISPANPANTLYAGKNSCVDRDLVLLFMLGGDKPGTASGYGQTGIGKLCGTSDDTQLSGNACADKNGWAYAVSSTSNWEVTAHEIGHTFGASHDFCGLMCANYSCNCSGTPINKFSYDSKSQIYGHVFGTGILGFACPPRTYGSCLLNLPVQKEAIGIAGGDLICSSGTYSLNTGESAFWSTDDPGVTLLSQSSGKFMDVQCTQGQHVIKATFNHNCELVTQYKVFWSGLPPPPITYWFEDACGNQGSNSICWVLTLSYEASNTQYATLTSSSNWTSSYGNFYLWNLSGNCVDYTYNAYNYCGSISYQGPYCKQGGFRGGSDNQFNLYPNPVNNELTIQTSESGSINIYDVLGKQIAEYATDSDQALKVDCSQWATGVYVVKYQVSGNTIAKKIQITH